MGVVDQSFVDHLRKVASQLGRRRDAQSATGGEASEHVDDGGVEDVTGKQQHREPLVNWVVDEVWSTALVTAPCLGVPVVPEVKRTAARGGIHKTTD